MAGLCAVLMLYIVLISLGLVSWGKLAGGFDNHDPKDITRIACEVRVDPSRDGRFLHSGFFFYAGNFGMRGLFALVARLLKRTFSAAI